MVTRVGNVAGKTSTLKPSCLSKRLHARVAACFTLSFILSLRFIGTPNYISDDVRSNDTDRIRRTVVWSTDLHAGPIGCQVSMFSTLNIDVEAEVDFKNCKLFRSTRGTNVCAKDRGGLRNNRNRGFSLDPKPNNTRKQLFEHYRRQSKFAQSDVVFCSHPAANCEVYLPFDKSILVYNTQRLEFGRDDEFVVWRQKIIGSDRQQRWQHWIHNLHAISKSHANIVAANNMYDVTHMEYYTGIKTKYIPSWCGDLPHKISTMKYNPQRTELVLTPYRGNLEYALDDIPKRGWPDVRRKSYRNPLSHPVFDDLKHLRSEFELINMKQAFPSHGNFRSIHDFQNFRAVVLIPYAPSTMFFFQLYRSCVPILVPSRELLSRWIAEHGILWETSYGDPKRLNDTMHSHLPNPSSFDVSSRKSWMQFYDVYRTDVFPYILYFDSWEHAASMVQKTDFQMVSANMRLHNVNEFYRIRDLWLSVFEQMATHRNIRSETRKDHDINSALWHQYKLEPLSFTE